MEISPERIGQPIRCGGCHQVFLLPPQLPHPRTEILRCGRLQIASATTTGRVRERNEDAVIVQRFTRGSQKGAAELALLFVVDGMGGHAGGDRAAQLACGAFLRTITFRLIGLLCGEEEIPEDHGLLDLLDHGLWEANRLIARRAAEEPQHKEMGATAIAALIVNERMVMCHVGDCRGRLYRNGRLGMLTQDQTLARRMVALGHLSESEARDHPTASQVTQALGRHSHLEPSHLALELQSNDWLVLASDGLHTHLESEAIGQTLSRADSAEQAARRLVEQANENGGSDNCSVVVVQVR
jgi:protein phosphatase